MAKKLWMTLGVIGIAVVLGFGMYQSNASHAEPTLSAEDIKELVQSQYPGTLTELELTKGATGALYEVEVVNDGVEYEIMIDGNSGEILNLKEKLVAAKEQASKKETIDLKEQEEAQKAAEEKEQAEKAEAEAKKQKEQEEVEKKQATNEPQQKTQVEKKATPEKQAKQPSKEKQAKNKKTSIDVKQAIDIALEQYPGVVEDVELDEDNGRLIYEIEIRSGDEEAEFEIDAYTGEILVIEIDD